MQYAHSADTTRYVSLAPESWGWKSEFHAAWAASAEGSVLLYPARVTSREHHLYEIVCPDFSPRPGFEALRGGAERLAGYHSGVRVTGKFEYEAADRSAFPACGDWVLVRADEGAVRIHAVLGRRTSLSRGMAGPTTEEQVLAANIDTLFLVFALDGGRNFLARLLERALFVARNSGSAPCIVLNKADLAESGFREAALADAARLAPAVPVVALSAKTGEGMAELAALLSPGETVGMLGKSGVGKSALLNALANLGLAPGSAVTAAGNPESLSAARGGAHSGAEKRVLSKEGGVREDDRQGRHTTTSSRLFALDSGILVIDSPGIRELKIWGDAEGLEDSFPEIAELAASCRFADCSHGSEPGCAVRAALEGGTLDERRFDAWLDLRREQAFTERRTDERARREELQKWKRISKFQKELKKSRE